MHQSHCTTQLSVADGPRLYPDRTDFGWLTRRSTQNPHPVLASEAEGPQGLSPSCSQTGAPVVLGSGTTRTA